MLSILRRKLQDGEDPHLRGDNFTRALFEGREIHEEVALLEGCDLNLLCEVGHRPSSRSPIANNL